MASVERNMAAHHDELCCIAIKAEKYGAFELGYMDEINNIVCEIRLNEELSVLSLNKDDVEHLSNNRYGI